MSVNIRTLFGNRVRKVRSSLGLSQEDLAFRCGLHRTYLSDIERGTRNVSIENIEKIAISLNIAPMELFNFQEGEEQ